MEPARRFPLGVALLLSLLLTACSDGTKAPVPATISISGGATTFSYLGETAQFSASVMTKKGKAIPDATVSWSSSASGVVEVNSSGQATARSNGTAQVTASYGGITGSRAVTVAQVPEDFVKVAGDGQTATVGTELPTELRVRVKDSAGNLISGGQVTFAISKGNGTVSASAVSTDGSGEAAVRWTLGTVSAEAQEVTATAGSRSATFSATATPDDPAALVAAAGDAQTGYAREALAKPVQAKVTDSYGNPLPEVQVQWVVATGGGAISASYGTSDAQGVVETEWTMGPMAGENTLQASSTDLPTLTFSATALANGVISGTVTVTGGNLVSGQDLSSPQELIANRMGLLDSGRSWPVIPRDLPPSAFREPEMARSPAGAPSQPDAVPGELLVLFEPGSLGAPSLGSGQFRTPEVARDVARALSSRLAAAPGADRFSVDAVSPAGLSAKIRVDPSEAGSIAEALRRTHGIRAVEPNFIVLRRPIPLPDAGGGSTIQQVPQEHFWPLQAWHYEMIRLPEAWDITTGSQSVTVAVVDDGIRFDHADLTANLTDDGFDFVSDYDLTLCAGGTIKAAGDGDGPDPDPTIPVQYTYQTNPYCVSTAKAYGGHGTHVAGTIGAVGDGWAATGVNWNVEIRPVRALSIGGYGTTWDINQGILYAAGLPASDGVGTVQAPYPADIINLSLGSDTYSATQDAAVTAAYAAGSLVVAAAGNDGVTTLHYPAALTDAMAVSSVDANWNLSSFSNFGSWIDIAAPGGTGGGTDQTWDVLSTLWHFEDGEERWDFYQGTSMATPHVSGVAALLLAASPGLSPSQLWRRLTNYAYPLGSSTFYGSGLVDAYASLTEGASVDRDTYVRVVDATDGQVVASGKAGANGTYSVSHLPDGSYYVFAGMDEWEDGEIGLPGRLWGGYGGSAVPTPIPVQNSGFYTADFNLGFPIEQENNGSAALADYLTLNGYMNGDLGTILDEDWYVVQIPASGTYTFSTLGWLGGCGMAAQANTQLEVWDGTGAILASQDDEDTAGYRHCAEITLSLAPGAYYLRVLGSTSGDLRGVDQASGYYRVQARTGG